MIAVCGHGRHGKCEASRFLAGLAGLRYVQSTSEAAASKVYELWGRDRYHNEIECWRDRHNHRETWAELIWNYNGPEGTRLYRDMRAENDIIDGIRRASELQACVDSGIVGYTVWVDASRRVGTEDPSNEIRREDCQYVIDNNSDLADLRARCRQFLDTIGVAVVNP